MQRPAGDAFPRQLRSDERDALVHLLRAQPEPFREAYLAQVPHARAIARCPCGCPTIDLEVAGGSVPPAQDTANPLPIEGQVELRGLIIFTKGGYLSGLELYSMDGEPLPDRFPVPDAIQLINYGPPDEHGARHPHPYAPPSP